MSHARFVSKLAALFISLAVVAGAFAQDNQSNYPPTMPGATVETYKTIGDVAMKIWIFNPDGHKASDKRPAIVFFFGGGWRSGSPQQFLHQAQYLASRGMVAMAADYRVAGRHGVKMEKCVADAKSAIRWVRANAARLGVDPDRVAAGGGSAGGHLAAAVATLPGLDAPADDTGISTVPNALVLFNPACVLAPVKGRVPFPEDRYEDIRNRAGVAPEAVSPYHHVKKGTPPTILFHGKADTTVPYRTAELFCEKMKAHGNRCELTGYEGQAHGFFNYGRGDNKAYLDTARRMDEFLASLGYLTGPPTVKAP